MDAAPRIPFLRTTAGLLLILFGAFMLGMAAMFKVAENTASDEPTVLNVELLK